jgi:hypothetical protein
MRGITILKGNDKIFQKKILFLFSLKLKKKKLKMLKTKKEEEKNRWVPGHACCGWPATHWGGWPPI